ncbi:LysR family transcriptional regulator [Pseudonocardia sp.]|uniref:LysR family transcriptional regulator n=1 Tax=Pseudonocardia sp. TaxID=60912 RepID=UPI003D0A03D0
MPGEVLLRQLEYVAALDRERHFARAARECHVSQSALSTAIRKLEIQLGVTIVLRGRRFQGFTPEGERVVGWAHRILAERDGLHDDLERMRGGLAATLRIGAIPTSIPASSVLIDRFCARHPKAMARVDVTTSREIRRRLADFELDVGLTYLDLDTPPVGLRTRALYRERYVLLTPDDGPLAGRDGVGWAEAATLPQCALNRQMQNRRILDHLMAAAGAELRPTIETDTVAALYTYAATRRWSCIVAHPWTEVFGVPAGTCAVPLLPQSHRPAVGLIWPDRKPESLATAALLDAIADLGDDLGDL